MELSEFAALAEALKQECLALLHHADPAQRLDAVKGALNALKDERLARLQREVPTMATPLDKRGAGKLFNELKGALDAALADFAARQVARTADAPWDGTLPARHHWTGSLHPVTLVVDEICAIFRELGFTIALGPEAETEWYNFGALNFPPDHPAMELHDTLYLGEGALLRTHTSPVQVRTLQRCAPPVRDIAPGQDKRHKYFIS